MHFSITQTLRDEGFVYGSRGTYKLIYPNSRGECDVPRVLRLLWIAFWSSLWPFLVSFCFPEMSTCLLSRSNLMPCQCQTRPPKKQEVIHLLMEANKTFPETRKLSQPPTYITDQFLSFHFETVLILVNVHFKACNFVFSMVCNIGAC